MSAGARASYFLRSAAGGIRHAPLVHFIAVLTIAIALFTAGLARGVAGTLDTLVQGLGGEVQLTAYLEAGTSEADAQALAVLLQERTRGEAHAVSPEAAMERLAHELGVSGKSLLNLPDNPLPRSVELRVPPHLRSPERLAHLVGELEKKPGVTGVDYGVEAVERLAALSRVVELGGAVAVGIAVLAAVLIVAAVLQLAIYARREEIEIQKLVGATDRFVQLPFLLEGLFQGLCGAAVALVGLLLFSRLVLPSLGALFAFLSGPAQGAGAWVSGPLVLELLAAGGALGLVGSALAVSRFLRV